MSDTERSIDVAALARMLAPHIAQELLSIPTYWGEKSRVHTGNRVTVNNCLFNVVSGEVFIGDNSFFGHNVCVLTGTHDVGRTGLARLRYPASGNDIHIGSGVWVASNATILGPCRIGDDAVISAGAVLLPGVYEGGKVYAGVPARAVKDLSAGDVSAADGRAG